MERLKSNSFLGSSSKCIVNSNTIQNVPLQWGCRAIFRQNKCLKTNVISQSYKL